MVVAKTLETQNHIVKEIQARTVSRIYDALVYGVANPRQGRVDRPIGRHPIHRKKMAIRRDGKEARTNYRVLEQFDEHALVECQLDTGRTHQIRVHLQSLGNPGDQGLVMNGCQMRSAISNVKPCMQKN